MTATGTTARERLFNQPRRTKQVTLTTGDVVEVRPLSFAERAAVVKASRVDGEVDTEKLVPALIIACTHLLESGEKMFTEGDRETIANLTPEQIDPLSAAAVELNGLDGEKAVAKAEQD